MVINIRNKTTAQNMSAPISEETAAEQLRDNDIL